MKRGQFELMGLAIIVVIISMAVFFLLAFSFKPQSDPAGQFFQEQFAQNVLDAWAKTSLRDCSGTVNDYLQWTLAGGYPITGECREDNFDEYMSELVDVLETAVGDYTGLKYRLEIHQQTCEQIIGCDALHLYENGCDPRVQQVSRPGVRPIVLYPQPEGQAILWLCDAT